MVFCKITTKNAHTGSYYFLIALIFVWMETDVNECSESRDICNGGRCLNTYGSFHCICSRGLVLRGGVCEGKSEASSYYSVRARRVLIMCKLNRLILF